MLAGNKSTKINFQFYCLELTQHETQQALQVQFKRERTLMSSFHRAGIVKLALSSEGENVEFNCFYCFL